VFEKLLTVIFRGFILLTVCLSALHAQDFPNKTIKIIVPYAPGGASDILARIVAEDMSKSYGQSVVIENKAGASGTTGSEIVSRSPPDGYTLVMGTSASHSVNTIAFSKTYDPLTAFTSVALLTVAPNVIFVSPSLPIYSPADLVKYLKANPGTGIATSGPATSGRFAAELFMSKVGVDLTTVPYGGSAPAAADVRAGHAKIGITDLLAPTPFIKNGSLRAIAVTSLQRSSSLPDVPTVAESLSPGFDAVAWIALFAPPQTPASIVNKLNASVKKVLSIPEVKLRVDALGHDMALGSPADLHEYVRADIARWKEVAKNNKLNF
jgi:tripartite-type tricarboxylate transporter receptor subunit TctC